MNSEKKHYFRYDLIRAFAAITIVLYHFNTEILSNGLDSGLQFSSFGVNINLSHLGLVLFFLLSGEMSAKSFGSELTKQGSFKKALLSYYKKRLLAILPMYWIAYILFFAADVYPYGVIPGPRMILSFAGMDGYLTAHGVSCLYLLGEWFIGAILILYTVFPFIYCAVRKHPVIMLVILAIIEILSVPIFVNSGLGTQDALIYLAPFSFGIYFSLYVKKIRPVFLLFSLIVSIIVLFIKLPFSEPHNGFLIGISFYIILLSLGSLMEGCEKKALIPVKAVFSFIAKYSYPIFLVHHRVLNWFLKRYPSGTYLNNVTYIRTGLIYLAVTLFFSIVLYGADYYIKTCLTHKK